MVHSRQIQIDSCRSVGLDELWLSDTNRCTGVKSSDSRAPESMELEKNVNLQSQT